MIKSNKKHDDSARSRVAVTAARGWQAPFSFRTTWCLKYSSDFRSIVAPIQVRLQALASYNLRFILHRIAPHPFLDSFRWQLPPLLLPRRLY
ncbi:hypothetical protein CK203_053524 [Vitis vinifera]|uniref:Uncharacterized protein n=1 Tax=Vitis vinifera TaxID=29760 RepID=A0A438JE12_VITVI|nr:hypothetical protein CK203_053524 [Vitis vinifera]